MKPKFPIEDSEIPLYVKSSVGMEMGTLQRPPVHRDFIIGKEVVSLLIQVWNFCFVYARPLQLMPFTLDDLEQSLICQEQMPPLLGHVFFALLHCGSKQAHSHHQKVERQSRQLPRHKFLSMQKQLNPTASV